MFTKRIYSTQLTGETADRLFSNITATGSLDYGLEAIINPKILTGIDDYITASTQIDFNNIQFEYDFLAKQISRFIPKFVEYYLRRVDYCINFDLKELRYICTRELMMKLIKCGDIPTHYQERYDSESRRRKSDANCFYLVSKSATINCYLKQPEWEKNHPDRPGIESSEYVIRFEVQCLPRKTYCMRQAISQKVNWFEFCNYAVTTKLLSDEKAEEMVLKYFKKVIRTGDYYTLTGAISKVKEYKYCPSKEARLVDTLKQINLCRGISKARTRLENDHERADFNRSLRELDEIAVNPVTIPRDDGVKFIPNLLRRHDEMMGTDILGED